MSFIDAVQSKVLEDFNTSITENGAVGYRTTGKSLLDLNFSVASLRRATDEEIIKRFHAAFYEDKVLAMKWLFFARDVRGGLGERRLFRTAMKAVADREPKMAHCLFGLIPEYGRYDDLWCLLDTPVRDSVISYVFNQIINDTENMVAGKSISLLAKWMPSINATSEETKRYARILRNGLGMSDKTYRKVLSDLRRYLDVVETKMSAGKWSEIKYEAVPSRANLVYNGAFLRNDYDRRSDYLRRLEKGETKINASVLYPHDIVHKYGVGRASYWGYSETKSYDPALEAMWRSLPDMVNGCGNTIVVADGSGSMLCKVGKSETTALDVANALAIYFAERSSGEFRDKYITFSNRPQLVDLSSGSSLLDKLMIASAHHECSNTNIEAVFDLILDTAVSNDMRQEDIPANVLIISDMEFDESVCTNSCCYGGFSEPLFKTIEKKYWAAGYKLPRLVFWNVNSRTSTIPVRENDLGVALVSGFSVNICKMVMSGKLDPYECLLETINSERYEPVETALKYAMR